MYGEVAARLAQVRERVEAACARTGRDAGCVGLMAVTKTHGREAVLAAREAGVRVFGENRVREAEEKYGGWAGEVELHLIGHLQSNKARSAAGLFSWVDSLDSFRTASALDARLAEAGRTANVLLEVNTSGEGAKSGYGSFEELLRELDAILALMRK